MRVLPGASGAAVRLAGLRVQFLPTAACSRIQARLDSAVARQATTSRMVCSTVHLLCETCPATSTVGLMLPSVEDVIAVRAVERWVAHGLDCAIAPGYASLNGYVRLPPGHVGLVLAEAVAATRSGLPGYDVLDDVVVHGGLTYGPDDCGWVGFDTAHAWDWWAPDDLTGLIDDKALALAMDMRTLAGDHPRWTRERLRAEVERLAAQLAQARERVARHESC